MMIIKNLLVIIFSMPGFVSYSQSSKKELRTETDNFRIEICSQCLKMNNPVKFKSENRNAEKFFWNFSDGTSSFKKNPKHIFSDFGYYCIRLITVDKDGIKDTTDSVIFINPPSYDCHTLFDIATNTNINGDVTWDNNAYPSGVKVEGDVYVPAYQTLRINGISVYFAPKARLIVKKGGQLYINNSTLTSLSNTYMWQGIEVWGTPYESSHSVNQGKLVLGSLCTIENAHIAVLLGARKDNVCGRHPANIAWMFNNALAGGIITMGKQNTFSNNGMDIKFLPKNSNSNDGSSNVIYYATFNCTPPLLDEHYNSSTNSNPYPNLHNPWAGSANPNQRSYIGIQSTNISKLNINLCTFKNHEYGIYSLDAQQTKVNYCTFQYMRRGMRIENSTPTLQSGYDITNCTFDKIPGNTSGALAADDGTAIYINSGTGYHIHDGNTFKNSYIPFNNPVYGIRTSNASVLNISNNTFTSQSTGIYVDNSGAYASKILAESSGYSTSWTGNIFNLCTKGIVTLNNNSNLCIRCNTHNSTQPGNNNWETTSGGTLANQGLSGSQFESNLIARSQYGAGNEFYSGTNNIYNHNNNSYYRYYYQNSPPCFITPIGPITPILVSAPMYQNSQSCPFPGYISLPGPVTPFTPLTAPVFIRLDSLKNAVVSLQAQYQNMVSNADKGHTQELLTAIEATPPSGQLKNMLVSNSPLSDTVLIALNTLFPLSNGNYKLVMDENLPVTRKVAPSFYNRVVMLPNGIKNQLLSKQANNPGKTTLGSVELQLDQAEQDKALYFSEVISALLDTNVNRKADAIALFEQEGTPDANLILASTYMSDSNYTAAATKIAQLPDDNDAYTDWKNYASLLLSQFEQGKTMDELDSNQIAYIRALAYQCPENQATANAKALLFYLCREEVLPCPINETRIGKLQGQPDNNSSSFLGENYPDPFTNLTVIPCYLPQGVEGELVIKDITGRIMTTLPLQEGNNRLEIDTRNWADGVYIYSMLVNGETIEARKMVKNK